MKKWVIIFIFSACCTIFISLLNINVTAERKIIHIKNSDPVIADHVSQSDQFVFYESDGKSGMFMKNDVASVGSITIDKQIPLIRTIDRWGDGVMDRVGWRNGGREVFDSRIFIFLVSLVAASAVFKLFQVLLQWRGTSGFTKKEEDTPFSSTGEASGREDKNLENADVRDIALFFLELFKVQNGLGKEAPAQYKIADHASSGKMKIFELSAMDGRDWLTRRMSLGLLGEETGSKSKCYYVIYDTHMVIKLPPTPVTDMGTYLKAIRKEVKIAAQLSPVACIVPMVSVVLKKVVMVPYQSTLTQEQVEKQYIRLLEVKPQYQAYLKVGGRFAFFMELTNNIFLRRVIDEIHQLKNQIGDEIREVPEVAWNQEVFTTRYGLVSLPVFNNLQTLYRLCESEVQRIVHASGKQVKIHTFQIKSWFLSRIVGEKLEWVDKTGDDELIGRIEDGFTAVFESKKQIVDDFLRLLKSQLTTKVFVKSRHPIENIASNTLALLCRLKEKQIALRDLKPDNLFMDANPDQYPGFLKDRGLFSIGVIDVETAVSLSPAKNGLIEQPLLGGTPLYATPLHLFRNETLSSCFTNFPDTLYFQDWYATIGILFKATTGKDLFVQASRSFPMALKHLKQSRSRFTPEEKTVKTISQTFWSAALADMKRALAIHSHDLNQLTVSVPEAMVPEIVEELKREKECLKQAIKRHVAISPLLKSRKNRTFLIEASIEAIEKQVARWENPAGCSEQHRHLAPKMGAFLRNLNRLKQGETEKSNAIATLANSPGQITVYSLLEAMFQVAYRAMHTFRWGTLAQPDGSDDRQAAVTEDRSMVTTILSDH